MPGRVEGNLPPNGPQRAKQDNASRAQENRNKETVRRVIADRILTQLGLE
jgi:hypothetical protein